MRRQMVLLLGLLLLFGLPVLVVSLGQLQTLACCIIYPEPLPPEEPAPEEESECSLIASGFSPQSVSSPPGGAAEFTLTLKSQEGTWSQFSAKAEAQPPQDGIHLSLEGLPSSLADGKSAKVTVHAQVGTDVLPQTYTISLVVRALCEKDKFLSTRRADLIVGRSGLVESPSSEEPLTLAATICEGNPYSSEGETCKYDYEDDNIVDGKSVMTCTAGPPQSCTTVYDDGSKYTQTCSFGVDSFSCIYEYDNDGDSNADSRETQICTTGSSSKYMDCTSEYDDDGDTITDRKRVSTCTDINERTSCTVEYDDDGDDITNRKETETCVDIEAGYVCSYEYDDDGDGITDRKKTESCTIVASGAYSCTEEWDDDDDKNTDHKSTKTGASELPIAEDPRFPSLNQRNSPPPLSVVVNEVAWMGTLPNSSSSHEWIELYNPTNHSISLNGWRLISSKPDASVQVILKGKIPARGYFLLEQLDDSTVSDVAADFLYSGELLDEGMALILLDPAGNRVDGVNLNGGAWPAGARVGALALSMERIDPLRADADDNWGTNNTVTRNGRDALGNPLNGTPKARNSVTQ